MLKTLILCEFDLLQGPRISFFCAKLKILNALKFSAFALKITKLSINKTDEMEDHE